MPNYNATSPYLVFLDIDGVLTSHRVHASHGGSSNMWSRFDPVAVDLLNRLHDFFDVEFVISSAWQEGVSIKDPQNFLWVEAAFRSAGFRGKFPYPSWKVDPEGEVARKGYGEEYTFTVMGQERKTKRKDRPQKIQHYVEQHTSENFLDYLILDDSDFGFEEILGPGKFVKTDPENGILWAHIQDIFAKTSHWNLKNGKPRRKDPVDDFFF